MEMWSNIGFFCLNKLKFFQFIRIVFLMTLIRKVRSVQDLFISILTVHRERGRGYDSASLPCWEVFTYSLPEFINSYILLHNMQIVIWCITHSVHANGCKSTPDPFWTFFVLCSVFYGLYQLEVGFLGHSKSIWRDLPPNILMWIKE